MTLKLTYSNFIYLDTNIISNLVKGKINCASFYNLCFFISFIYFFVIPRPYIIDFIIKFIYSF